MFAWLVYRANIPPSQVGGTPLPQVLALLQFANLHPVLGGETDEEREEREALEASEKHRNAFGPNNPEPGKMTAQEWRNFERYGGVRP